MPQRRYPAESLGKVKVKEPSFGFADAIFVQRLARVLLRLWIKNANLNNMKVDHNSFASSGSNISKLWTKCNTLIFYPLYRTFLHDKTLYST